MAVLRIHLFLLSLLLAAAPAAAKHVALVVGDAHYVKVGALDNPINDARAIATLLKGAGFEVDLAADLDLAHFKKALSDFEVAADGADIAVIYFSGHGLEMGGENFLVPVDARLARDIDVPDETVSLDRLLQAVSGARRLKLVILDACRNNPFAATMQRVRPAARSVGTRGLGRIEPEAPDTLVAYAARAGTLASDGSEGNSPFTKALLHHLVTPGLDIRLALGRVRDEVLAATGKEDLPQEPFVYGSLGGAELPLVPAGASAQPSPDQIAWSLIADSTQPSQIAKFIADFPLSPLREQAESRLRALQKVKIDTLDDDHADIKIVPWHDAYAVHTYSPKLRQFVFFYCAGRSQRKLMAITLSYGSAANPAPGGVLGNLVRDGTFRVTDDRGGATLLQPLAKTARTYTYAGENKTDIVFEFGSHDWNAISEADHFGMASLDGPLSATERYFVPRLEFRISGDRSLFKKVLDTCIK